MSSLVATKGVKQTRLLVLRDPVSRIPIRVEEGGFLTVICINLSSCHVEQTASVASNAALHIQNVTLASDVDHVLCSKVIGYGGASSIDWMFYANGEDRHSITARNVFSACCGKGEITINGVAAGCAQVSCHGVIEIGPDGGGTDTYLTEHVLMLDRTTRVRAVPSLKIQTDDVRASHSATVSRISGEDLFYFGSRGIPEEHARQMLTEGFLQAIVNRIGDENVRQRAVRELKKKLTIDLR